MEYKKEILVSNYFDIHNFYSNIYGIGRTIVLMQVGSFHECYCTNTDGLNLIDISQKLDVVCTKKNNKEPVSSKNPRMLGFPIFVTDNFIEKLCNLNYTVIKIDQTSEPPKPKREVVGIFSYGTFIEKQLNSLNTNFIVSIIIDKIKNNHLCIGIASYDLTTGYGSYYETYSTSNDIMLSLDNANRYLETCPPKEIILNYSLKEDEQINNLSIKDILLYLNIDDKITFNYYNKNNEKLSYQKMIFEKIFINVSNIFEILNLHLYNWARIALTNLYDYVQLHQLNLINKLKLPEEFENSKYLYLGNHSLDQLNVFNKNTNDKSLFQIINKTKTNLGKRYLFDALSKPIVDIQILNERYNLIDTIIKNKYYNDLSNFLEDISDIERLNRRIELGTIQPFELYLLYLSLYQIDKLAILCNNNNIFNIDNNYNVNNTINYIKNTFNIELINSLNFTNFTEFDNNIFNLNKYKQIDNLMEEINSCTNFMDNLIKVLSSYIQDKRDEQLITLKHNDRDGHYLFITNKRCENLINKLKGINDITIGKHKLNVSDLSFVKLPTSTYTKINCSKIKEISNEITALKIKMAKLTKEFFKEEIMYINQTFSNIFKYWGKQVSYIDFINSGAITAIQYHYTKPIIDYNEISYFKSSNIRHPIVEYISKDYEYKPHNIGLGYDSDNIGILLYGINSSGKSTLMKSIGLNIILGQIGYFVAADNFIFSPYFSLFTRISSNDNIYKGLSSFMVELIEISSILKRNNKNTLVLADEIAKGSEITSASVIVTYMMKTLCESNSSFITATHLHDLTNLPTIKTLKGLQIKHIKLTYDESNDCLIYDRILSNGSGSNFYGLQVAKYLMKDTKFNEITTNILEEYNNTNIKSSKYNKDFYLLKCELCKITSNLECHHIVFQKDFNENLINKDKIHYQKDAKYNLVTLCKECHDNIDRNIYIINGWIETTTGRKLDYLINETILKPTKYNTEMINFIKQLKNETTNPSFARIKIKEKFNKKVSSKTILNLWS